MIDTFDPRPCRIKTDDGMWTFDYVAGQPAKGIVPELVVGFESKGRFFSGTLSSGFKNPEDLRRIGQYFAALASHMQEVYDEAEAESEDYDD